MRLHRSRIAALATSSACTLLMLCTTASAETPMATPRTALAPSCTDGLGHRLDATATAVVDGNTDKFTEFTYEISGSGTGGKSNVNITILSNGNTVWHRNSPDDLKDNVLYRLNSSSQVGPKPPVYVDRFTNEQVIFEAVFDTSGPDHSCTAVSRVF